MASEHLGRQPVSEHPAGVICVADTRSRSDRTQSLAHEPHDSPRPRKPVEELSAITHTACLRPNAVKAFLQFVRLGLKTGHHLLARQAQTMLAKTLRIALCLARRTLIADAIVDSLLADVAGALVLLAGERRAPRWQAPSKQSAHDFFSSSFSSGSSSRRSSTQLLHGLGMTGRDVPHIAVALVVRVHAVNALAALPWLTRDVIRMPLSILFLAFEDVPMADIPRARRGLFCVRFNQRQHTPRPVQHLLSFLRHKSSFLIPNHFIDCG